MQRPPILYKVYRGHTTHLNEDTFKFAIKAAKSAGVRVEPCPIVDFSQPIKVYVDTSIVFLRPELAPPNTNIMSDSLYMWFWIDGWGGGLDNGFLS